MAKYLGQTGLVYLWGKMKSWVQNYAKIVSSTGKDTITAGNNSVDIYGWAQASTKPSYTAGEVGALPSTTSIPSKTSDLTNDSGFITTSDIPEGAAASTSTPLMDGTAAVGTELAFARGDHRHPSDTSKQDVISDLATIRSGAEAGATAYQKPSTGIPESDLASAVQTKLTAASNAIPTTQKGAANGVCPLDANTKIDAQYLPSYVDDVVEAYIRSGQTALSQSWLATGSATGTVITPQSGVIYVLMNGNDDYPTNSQYRWATNTYVKLNDGGVSELTTAEMDTATNNWT